MLPPAYSWLSQEPGPKMLVEALKLYGTVEKPGVGDNPQIMAWARETGLSTKYSADSVPWCGLFMAYVAKKAVKPLPPEPLWAKNWAKFGKEQFKPMLGDVLVFNRAGGGGHVALYVGEDSAAWHVLGGNQSDAVNITRIDRARLFACRRPIYQIQPKNVRAVQLAQSGALSTNET